MVSIDPCFCDKRGVPCLRDKRKGGAGCRRERRWGGGGGKKQKLVPAFTVKGGILKAWNKHWCQEPTMSDINMI